MFISKLQISNLRNLQQVEIEPSPEINILYGPNGAGKTSVIEALVVLSRGRSFRTTQASELFGPTGKSFHIFAETHSTDGNMFRLGLQRTGKHWRARKDGQELSQLSHLTRVLPLVLMEPNTHLLVSGTPEFRRKYLDWSLFHVEQGFLDVYRRYSRALKQRNAALRSNQLDVVGSIDEVFAELGERLTQMRHNHSRKVALHVIRLLSELSPELQTVTLGYDPGWHGASLKTALSKGIEADVHRGVTGSGPHRADLVMTLEGKPARSVLSRGEQKILSSALVLSQAEILRSCGEDPVVLLDDLASEFDEMHLQSVVSKARETGGQVWITGTRKIDLPENSVLFHVEHGKVRRMV